MKTIGIVTEFNPFHDGHRYLIDNAKKSQYADFVIAIMSGNFMQRGYPALFDKWQRAKRAVEGGVNLVLELPLVFSCASAGQFAYGGVNILEKLGIVDVLAFGSESGNLNQLKKTVGLITKIDIDYPDELKEILSKGYSYPAARSKLIASIEPDFDDSILSEPNNILALEYLRHIDTLDAYTIKRIGKGHVETASDIRRIWKEDNPQKTAEFEQRYFDLVRSKLLLISSEEIDKTASAGEGLGNKIKSEIRYAQSLEELVMRVKSKRYTYSRINRLLVQALFGITNEIINEASLYVRPLAFDRQGATLLRAIKELSDIPVVDSIPKALKDRRIAETIKYDVLASDIYNIIYGNDLYKNSDFVQKPITII